MWRTALQVNLRRMGECFQTVANAKLLICVSLLFVAIAKSQWAPDGPPLGVLEQEFMQTGGITYFRMVAQLTDPCCDRLAGYNILRDGSSLLEFLQAEAWQDICLNDPGLCDEGPAEFVSVLGALPPGSYSLNLVATNGFYRPSSWEIIPFTVPDDSSPTLRLFPTTVRSQLMLQLAAVSNVTYVVEASADLITWTGIRTNSGPPFAFPVAATDNAPRFFRARMFSVQKEL